MLQRHMLILENNDMFTGCTAGKNCEFFDKSHPSWNYVSEKRKPQGDRFPWIATDLQKSVRLSSCYLACWQSGWVRCKTEPWGSNKWALCLKADDPKPYCFWLSTSSLWQRNRALWSDTFWNYHRWQPLFTVIPCPPKKPQQPLVPPAHQASEIH